MKYQNIVILTGAGISAESGIMTFRDGNGLWCNHRVEDVATPEGFARNPALVHDFYNMRRAQLAEVQPNEAHRALARFIKEYSGKITLITQNVDDLHERAGSTPLHMHGELKKARCDVCEYIQPWEQELSTQTPCPHCTRTGYMRPHIVWFGEVPFYMNAIEHALSECDLFISIGTSGNVYPAAGFVHMARSFGKAHTVELNLDPSNGANLFHEHMHGKATQIVPAYLDGLQR